MSGVAMHTIRRDEEERGRARRNLVLAGAALLFWVGLPSVGLSVQVERVIWNFHGRVVPEAFNPLAVRVVNRSAKPFEGAVVLHRTTGVGDRVGAKLVEPCYLTQGSSRWVLFHPYVRASPGRWSLRWGDGSDQQRSLKAPDTGPPATVALSPSGGLRAAGGGIERYPERAFPPSVTGTEGLHGVVLDHVPSWEGPRRRALLDWVRGGGTLHLVRGPTGKWPELSGEWKVLRGKGTVAVGERSSGDAGDAEPAVARVGAGRVVRHDRSLSEMTAEDLGPPTPTDQGPSGPPEPASSSSPSGFARDVLSKLKQAVQPEHNWAAIYALAVVYILLVGPGHFLLSRKWLDWRLSMALLFVLVAVFGVLYYQIGQRGYGEEASVHTLAHARPVGDGVYHVKRWSNLFVTRGGQYRITYPGSGHLFSTGQVVESVSGRIVSGKRGRFDVAIPRFSQRGVIHSGRMQGPSLDPEVAEWTGEASGLVVSCDASLLSAVTDACVAYRGEIYPMEVKERRLVTEGSPMAPSGPERSFARSEPTDRSPEAILDSLFRPAARRVVRDGASRTGRETAELLLYAPLPDGFGIRTSAFQGEEGRVLYHVKLRLPTGGGPDGR